MVSSAATMDRSNSSWNSEKMPTVTSTSCSSANDAADRELPFEAEPDVDDDGDERREHGDDAGAPQLARTAGPTTSMRRCVYSGPSASTTFFIATCCSASPPGCSSTRISTSVSAPKLWICTSPRPSSLSFSRSAARSAGPVLGCTSISEPPLKSTP